MAEEPKVDEDTGKPVSPETPPESKSDKPDTISSVSDIAAPHSIVYDGFDPAIHAVDAEGNPKKKPNGEYAKKRGRKSSGTVDSALPSKRANTTGNAPLTGSNGHQPGLTSDAAARQFTNAFIGGGVMIFGAEWEPEDAAEPKELKAALQDYFDSDGVPDIPAWFGVAIAFGGYSVKRLTKPTIADKLALWVIKLKRFFGRGAVESGV